MEIVRPFDRIVVPHDPYRFAAAPSGYLMEETFDSSGRDLSWTDSGSFANSDFDYTATVLQGTQSAFLSLSDSGDHMTYDWGSDQSEIWLYYIINRGVSAVSQNVWTLLNSSDSIVGSCYWRANQNADFVAGGGGAATKLIPDATTTHVWVRWKKGTGSNAEVDVYTSTTTTRPASPDASYATGTATTDARKIRILATGDSIIWDHIIVDSSEIGSSP